MKYLNKKRLLDKVQKSSMKHYSKVHMTYKLDTLTPETCNISILERFKSGRDTFISFKLKYKGIEDKWFCMLNKKREGKC